MKSSNGLYFSRLDHIRALAAYLVFVWHFTHLTNQFPVPYSAVPPFPFALLDEGHVGVGLFMTLSGYLFAKLVNGQAINYPAFLWSRAVRLVPLLAGSLAAWYLLGKLHMGPPIDFSQIWRGILLPTLPNGAWSITIEFQFYLCSRTCSRSATALVLMRCSSASVSASACVRSSGQNTERSSSWRIGPSSGRSISF